MSGWLTQDGPAGANVLPLHDLIRHKESQDCICMPRIELHGMTSCIGVLYVRKVIIHNAADGRE